MAVHGRKTRSLERGGDGSEEGGAGEGPVGVAEPVGKERAVTRWGVDSEVREPGGFGVGQSVLTSPEDIFSRSGGLRPWDEERRLLEPVSVSHRADIRRLNVYSRIEGGQVQEGEFAETGDAIERGGEAREHSGVELAW